MSRSCLHRPPRAIMDWVATKATPDIVSSCLLGSAKFRSPSYKRFGWFGLQSSPASHLRASPSVQTRCAPRNPKRLEVFEMQKDRAQQTKDITSTTDRKTNHKPQRQIGATKSCQNGHRHGHKSYHVQSKSQAFHYKSRPFTGVARPPNATACDSAAAPICEAIGH